MRPPIKDTTIDANVLSYRETNEWHAFGQNRFQSQYCVLTYSLDVVALSIDLRPPLCFRHDVGPQDGVGDVADRRDWGGDEEKVGETGESDGVCDGTPER